MEIINKISVKGPTIKAAIFDFDGTISTLRCGWEEIIEPMMIEMISGHGHVEDDLLEEVREYIDYSTGIQTIYQMKWLAEKVKEYGRSRNLPTDPWWYKAEYNKRLMELVEKRKQEVLNGTKKPEEFLIKEIKQFLGVLYIKGVELFAVSGTDHPDVIKEAELLEVNEYFSEIAGAPLREEKCSKEAVLKKLIGDRKLTGPEVVVIGDGKVEIALGRKAGTVTLGVASDEKKRSGVNPIKRGRLVNAGVHAIVGDYEQVDVIIKWMGLIK